MMEEKGGLESVEGSGMDQKRSDEKVMKNSDEQNVIKDQKPVDECSKEDKKEDKREVEQRDTKESREKGGENVVELNKSSVVNNDDVKVVSNGSGKGSEDGSTKKEFSKEENNSNKKEKDDWKKKKPKLMNPFLVKVRRIDRDEAAGWRSTSYFKHRNKILELKQNKHTITKEINPIQKAIKNSNRFTVGQNRSNSLIRGYNDNIAFVGQPFDRDMYLEWRQFLLKHKKHTGLYFGSSKNPIISFTPTSPASQKSSIYGKYSNNNYDALSAIPMNALNMSNIGQIVNASPQSIENNQKLLKALETRDHFWALQKHKMLYSGSSPEPNSQQLYTPLSRHDSFLNSFNDEGSIDRDFSSSEVSSSNRIWRNSISSTSDLDNIEMKLVDINKGEDLSTRIDEAYAFVGMHHIFERGMGQIQVTRLKFAQNDADIIGFASSDGIITIATTLKKPEILHILNGHKDGINDFDWSNTNEYIISVSKDKTIKVWNTDYGKCVRTIVCKYEPTCVIFHPLNNNIFVAGFTNNSVMMYNLSTGKPFQKIRLYYGACSLCFTPTGDVIFIGDAKSYLYIYEFKQDTGKLKRLNRTKVSHSKKPVSSVSYSCYNTAAKHSNPCLLVNASDNSVHLYHFNPTKGKLSLIRNFPISHKKENIRSVFCPLISFRNGACFVSGSENAEVCIFDLTREGKNGVNKLLGHGAPVLDVAWNYNESLLASCDKNGVIILWKRDKFDYEKEKILQEQRNIQKNKEKSKNKSKSDLQSSHLDKTEEEFIHDQTVLTEPTNVENDTSISEDIEEL